MLTLFENVRDIFRSDKAVAIPKNIESDVAYSNAYLLSSTNVPEYNPDKLIAGKGFDIYSKMMKDEQVKAVVRFRRDSVTARQWAFEYPDGVELSDKEKQFRIDLFTHIVSSMRGSFKRVLDGCMTSTINGFSLTEQVYHHIDYKGKSYYGLKKLRRKPAESFEFYLDNYGNLLQLKQRASGVLIDLDYSKFIHHVSNQEEHEFYGQSELREAYRAWYAKSLIITFWNMYLERAGGGFIWAKQTEHSSLTSNSADYVALKTIMSNIQNTTGIIMPKGVDLVVEYPSANNGYESAIGSHDKSIAKALLTPNLLGISEQSGTGSYAQSKTQMEAFLWMLDAEALSLEETLHEQCFCLLGDLNFGDGLYPRFVLKPLSLEQKLSILTMWATLLNANAVVSSAEDEVHIRKVLGMPMITETEDVSEAVDQSTALNGAQVSSMVEIMAAVSRGELPKTTAALLINESYPISEERAEEMLKDIVVTIPATKPMPTPPNTTDEPAKNNEDNLDKDLTDKNKSKKEETVLGLSTLNVQAEFRKAKASQRVAFKVIEKSADAIAYESVSQLSAQIARMIEPILIKVDAGLGTNPDQLEEIRALKFEAKQVGVLKKISMSALEQGWKLGTKHATDEVLKAGKQNMSINFVRLADNAADYLDNKAFTMAGNLSDATMLAIKGVLTNAIKADKSPDEIRDAIYKQLATDGLISKEDMQADTAVLLGAVNPDHRLNTVIRTNSFDAVNEARYNFFSDPDLVGFVEALEYDAVLDSRTTEICEHLDGRTYAVSGSVWDQGYRPPNHYNCRSLLIPITVNDTWEESEAPSVAPQEGFGI